MKNLNSYYIYLFLILISIVLPAYIVLQNLDRDCEDEVFNAKSISFSNILKEKIRINHKEINRRKLQCDTLENMVFDEKYHMGPFDVEANKKLWKEEVNYLSKIQWSYLIILGDIEDDSLYYYLSNYHPLVRTVDVHLPYQ